MKIGIIIHSHTGNTLSVAEGLKEAFAEQGHETEIKRIKAVSDNPNERINVRLAEIPDPAPYDLLVFGAPVWAFSLSSVMKAYLEQLPGLNGKKAECIITQHFSKKWLGGNHALKQMKRALTKKGADIGESGIINWTFSGRESQISDVITKLSHV